MSGIKAANLLVLKEGDCPTSSRWAMDVEMGSRRG